MRKTIEKLPESELAVMQLIWQEKEPVGSGKLVEILSEQKNWSRSTVQALLARLEEKDFVKVQKQGRIKLYQPKIKKEAYRKSETKNFLEQFYENSYKTLVANLVNSDKMNQEDLQEIMDMIEEKTKK